MGVTRTRRGGGGQVTSGLCGTTRTSGSACARCALLRGVPRALGLRARVDTRRPPSPAPRPPRFVEPSRAEPSRAESGRVGSGRVGPSRVVLTCRRWLLTRCMLSAGLLGRILPQPRTVHRMLVRTARDNSLTDGWISSRAGGAGAAGCCLDAVGRGRLPLSRGPGGPHGPEAAAAAPLAASGTVGAAAAGAADPAAAAASDAAMAPAPPPASAHRSRPRCSHFRQGAGPPCSLASGGRGAPCLPRVAHLPGSRRQVRQGTFSANR
jgi:hypothetical protein